jgi:hypothetical protein
MRAREHPGVVYDSSSGLLTVGQRSRPVGDLIDNESVLRAYLDLVAQQRPVPPGTRVDLRDDDLDALATLLDLDDVDLEAQMVRLLGVSAGEAHLLRRRLRARGLRSAAAALGLGVLASIPVAESAATPAARPTTEPSHHLVVASTSAPGDAPVVVVAAAPVAAPDAVAVEAVPAPAEEPATDDTEIGDAMYMEETDDGGTITYYESEPVPPAEDGTDIYTAVRIERDPPPPEDGSAEG